MARKSTRVTCPQGSSITIDDGIQRLDFFDLQMIVVPNVSFSGTVQFFLGDTIVRTVTYVNQRKTASFYSTPSDTIPSLFPATESNAFNRDAGEDGSELRASVKVTETGNATSVICKVHFLRRLISMRT